MSDNNLIVPDFDRERDEALRISLSKNAELSDVLEVVLIGRIDNYNTQFFQTQMDKILEKGYKKVLFKCASLEYISSSGFGVFVSSFSKVKEQNGTFVFSDIQSKVLEVFHLLGFDHLFNISNDPYFVTRYFDDDNLKTVEIFPVSFNCPVCESSLRTSKPGTFRCSKCKIVIKVDEYGTVTLK